MYKLLHRYHNTNTDVGFIHIPLLSGPDSPEPAGINMMPAGINMAPAGISMAPTEINRAPAGISLDDAVGAVTAAIKIL